MRLFASLVLVFALAAAAVAVGQAARRQAATELTVVVWPQGEDGPKKTWKLRCGPTGGTLPNRAAACRRLAALPNPFAPVPRTAICTAIFGGPQVALVTGHHGQRKIWARFSRQDGCQIDRWKRHGFLLQSGGA
jgi:Subtilisin inhibitor-like